MSKHAHKVKKRLNSIIGQMAKNPAKNIRNPKKDFTRKRKLSFNETVNFLLSMGAKSLSSELLEHFDYSVETPTASALSQQRSKISKNALPFLFRKFTDSTENLRTFKGYRLLAADGSALDIFRNPDDSETFRIQVDKKGYNQLHLNAFYDLCNNLYTDVTIQPLNLKDEYRALVDMVDKSNHPKKTIFIGDRGYESYNVFAHIEQKGHKYLIRSKDVNSNGMASALNLPKTDEFDVVVGFNLTRKQTNEVKMRPDIYKFLPSKSTFDYIKPKSDVVYPISFRVVRFSIGDGKHQTIITNLDKSAFPPSVIKELYQMRWGIETSFCELKYTIGLSHLHAKKADFVEQEIFARLIMYNFCQMIVLQVIIKQNQTKHAYQANFSMAVQVCKMFFKYAGKSPPDVEVLIQKYILPVRKNRTNARNISAKGFISFVYRVA